jgi:hypothetical protein
MTPRQYWMGWVIMAVGWLVSLIGACGYLGVKLERIIRLLEARY